MYLVLNSEQTMSHSRFVPFLSHFFLINLNSVILFSCFLAIYLFIFPIKLPKAAMKGFTEKIVNMMKAERLFESQGGPIILSQVIQFKHRDQCS